MCLLRKRGKAALAARPANPPPLLREVFPDKLPSLFIGKQPDFKRWPAPLLETVKRTAAQNIARGITFAPRGNRVLGDLTIMENLEISGYPLPRKEAKERIGQVLNLFPVLKERIQQHAGRFSDGKQQMLALARSRPQAQAADA